MKGRSIPAESQCWGGEAPAGDGSGAVIVEEDTGGGEPGVSSQPNTHIQHRGGRREESRRKGSQQEVTVKSCRKARGSEERSGNF